MKNPKWSALMLLAMVMSVPLTGCKQQGPVERAGEEIDEAVDTVKNGHESTANKVDDAVDDLRDGTKKAADELKSS